LVALGRAPPEADVGARARQALGHAEPDARAAAGDDRDMAAEVEHGGACNQAAGLDSAAKPLPTGGRYRARGAAPTISVMEQVARLIDADTVSLDARVARALARDGADCVVARFTYWYTGRARVAAVGVAEERRLVVVHVLLRQPEAVGEGRARRMRLGGVGDRVDEQLERGRRAAAGRRALRDHRGEMPAGAVARHRDAVGVR